MPIARAGRGIRDADPGVIGESVAHYSILRHLGGGGMGELYLAEDTKLGRRVALKFIAPDLTSDPETRSRFLREARAASAIDHPNVCAIYGIEETADGRSCIVMAYYDGVTLERRLQSGPLPIAEAIAIGAQVAEGLSRAHAAGIVHRDIKPSNVIVTGEGLVKILDFGVAKLASGPKLTVTDASIGTPGYMAPEQIVGGEVDHRADLWAVGVLVYVMLTGRPPFEGEGLQGSIYAVLQKEPVPLSTRMPEVPAGVDAVVMRCLRKPPEERPGSAAEIASTLRAELRALPAPFAGIESAEAVARAALHPVDTASPVSARAKTALSPSSPPPLVPATRGGRRRTLAIAGGLAVAIGAAVAGFLIARPGPLRVGVLPVTVEGLADSTEAKLAATAAEAGVVRGLTRLVGVSVADPAELRGLSDPEQMRRAIAADELIRMKLSASNDEWLVVLERLSGTRGEIRAAREFRAPQQPPTTLANALSVQLSNEYRRRARGGSAKLQISDSGYEEYVRLERAYRARDAGMTPREISERLEGLATREPRFVDVLLLQSNVDLTRYLTERDPDLLAASRSAALRAGSLAPEDPRPVSLLFRAANAARDVPEMKERLAQLRERNPGEVEIFRRESELAEVDGRAADALEAMRAAVRRRETRTMLQALAALEVKLGLVAEARVHLDTLVARFPDDRYPLSKLAQLELLYGDARKSDSCYSALIATAPGNVAYVANRGLARMLLARYPEAAADFREALRIAPANPAYLQNLGDVYDLAGSRDSARVFYAAALSRIADQPSEREANRLVSAQCLAHLGKRREAVGAIQDALRLQADNADALYTASLVYALSGDLASAVVNGQGALAKGVGVQWFTLPWFRPVLSDREFARSLEEARRRAALPSRPS